MELTSRGGIWTGALALLAGLGVIGYGATASAQMRGQFPSSAYYVGFDMGLAGGGCEGEEERRNYLSCESAPEVGMHLGWQKRKGFGKGGAGLILGMEGGIRQRTEAARWTARSGFEVEGEDPFILAGPRIREVTGSGVYGALILGAAWDVGARGGYGLAFLWKAGYGVRDRGDGGDIEYRRAGASGGVERMYVAAPSGEDGMFVFGGVSLTRATSRGDVLFLTLGVESWDGFDGTSTAVFRINVDY